MFSLFYSNGDGLRAVTFREMGWGFEFEEEERVGGGGSGLFEI